MQRKKEKAGNPGEAKDFEKSLKRLEQIVEQLEAGELGLDRSIELFVEGRKLGEGCMQYLTEIEQRLMRVIDDGAEEATVEPFAGEEQT